MTDFDKMSRRDFFTISGKAGLGYLDGECGGCQFGDGASGRSGSWQGQS